MALAFFVGALGEELGWSGYALDPLLSRMSALLSGLTLGGVAVIWHLVPLILLHRSPMWIAWWCVYALSSRVLIVWHYNNTNGSVFAVALFHATLNLAYMLFPIYGSHFDMRIGGLLTAFAAAAVTLPGGPEHSLATRATEGPRDEAARTSVAADGVSRRVGHMNALQSMGAIRSGAGHADSCRATAVVGFRRSDGAQIGQLRVPQFHAMVRPRYTSSDTDASR